MPQGCPLFVSENEESTDANQHVKSFSVREVSWITETQTDEQLYDQVVYKIAIKPKRLFLHLQRIYLTYKKGLADQLYAALVDLFVVLDGKGQNLSSRMAFSSRSILTENQMSRLESYLKHQTSSVLTGNKYTVLTKGLVGTEKVIIERKDKLVIDHDPLDIARDFVEYSQLDEAIETLESAVLADSSRHDIQVDLLELYKVTKNFEGFSKTYQNLQEKEDDLLKGWEELNEHFKGMVNEG